MKTTEIFVEQVLIGFLVLGATLLPYHGTAIEAVGLGGSSGGERISAAVLAVVTAAAVAIAYLVGIVLDRVADTLVDPFDEKHARSELEKAGGSGSPGPATLRARVLAKGGEQAEWMSYLRSRIRLTRALTVFLPAVGLSAALALLEDAAPTVAVAQTLVASVYAATLAWTSLLIGCKTKREEKGKSKREEKEQGEAEPPFWHDPRTPVYIGAALLAAGAVGLGLSRAGEGADAAKKTALVLIGGAVLTALSGWAWWRISATFFGLLQRAGRRDAGGPLLPIG